MSRAAPARWKIVLAGVGVAALGSLAFAAYGGIGNGTPTQRVKAWVSGSGLGQSIGTVVGDAARVRLAMDEHKSVGVLHTDCGVLLTDAQSANGELPTPDTQLTDLLSSGYALAYDSGTDCYNSGGTNTKLLEKATKERIEAEAKLQQATNLVGQLTGQTLSTTTTTQPDDGALG
ncbi:MAG TPA: hypothetical protein VEJ44_07155 [Acidimicrobiales bacterium]|nr:hypothetical protein [Acidimicrobiales bacterium]